MSTTAGLVLEAELWLAGYRAIAGVDEVGRGPWAGPVVAAAVILPADPDTLAPLLGKVDDSKRLSPPPTGAAFRRDSAARACGRRWTGGGRRDHGMGIAAATW